MGARWWICMLSVQMLMLTKCVQPYGATLCSPPCLLVSNTSDIVSIDYKTSAVDSVVLGLTRAVALDVHFSLGYIFWSDVTERNIKRFHIGTSSATTIISGIGVCDGLAVEWRTSQLYWTDTTYDTISVSDLSGNNQRSLISSELDEPRAIALDPDSGFMFWTDWGSNPKIERASLSGDQRLAIVTTNLSWPNGLDLDRGNRRIYWVDAGMDTVESVDYDGNKRKLLFQYTGLHLFAVALSPPFLFFTDWNMLIEVHQLDATTGKVLRSYSINGGRPMGIVLYDSSRQLAASSPCAVENGGCSHFCVTKTSGYECVCPTGLTVKEDNKTCEDRVKKFIIFADADAKSTNIISLDVDYYVIQTLFIHLGNQRPIALDFDPVEDRVYWSDVAQGLIVSAFYNATSVKILFRCNVQSPNGLVIDHVGRNLYWTDTGTNRIEVARLDGTSRQLLIKDGLDEPRAIVLDERNGMMYWTDWGANPKIEQAQMDGSARRIIVSGNLTWPNGLTIDQAINRLYWADAYLDKIEVSDLNGGNRQLIMSSEANIHPYGLAVYKNMLHWTDWNQMSISRFNLMDGNQEIVATGLQKPMDIHVFDPSLMFSGHHNCSQNNGLCSDLCLLKPGGYRCACPTGVVLKPDGKNCDYGLFYKVASEKFMIFAEADSGEIYKVPLTVSETPCYPLGINTNISRPVAVDYDPIEGKIYWTDVTLKLLSRAFPNGSLVEVLAHDNVETPDGIAVDYIGRNLYWTDAGTSKIEVARLDGSFRKSLITSNIEKPRSIILDISESKMYWSDWGSSPKIEQANMDGSARTTLVSSGLTWVNSLALDYQNRLLYWCDASLDKIERVDLQGNNRVLILDLSTENLHPFGLALSDNVLYWTDWNNQSVHKYNMTSSLSEVLVHGMGRPMAIHIYDYTKIFQGSTNCSQLNGGCSHICLPSSHGHRCFCPEGVQLMYDDAFTCEGVNRCPQLSAPPHGSLEPCSNLPGKTCRLACDRGYNLNGSTTRTCNSDGTWSGNQTQCNVVKCPAIKTPSHGLVFPTLCTLSIGVNYKTHCFLMCNDTAGYRLEGGRNVSCLETGSWSANTNKTICRDVQPPSIQCPSDIETPTEAGQSYARVTWQLPDPSDNSNEPLTLTGPLPPQTLTVGKTYITYKTIDAAGLSKSCTFSINVKDLEAPKIASCPEDIHITSKNQMNKVFLPGVTVTDNVGVYSFTTNRPNGSDFPWGEHNITYTASDKAQNTAKCHFRVVIVDYTCPDLPAPLNGAKACETWLTGMTCTVHCNEGFGFVNQPNPVYYCSPSGTWHNAKVPGKKTPALPDCSKTHRPQAALVNGALHYLVGQCGEETMDEAIASNFIELFKNSPFGMAGGCNGKCTIDNVRVACGGNQTEARRKRDAASDVQTSKIHLTVYFALKVPLPSNVSLVDLNQTNAQILNNMLKALNETDLNLNVSGVVIEYDASKRPVLSLISFLCYKGQVQRGANCVNCPVGYFFNTTGCHACPMDQYQDQEAQMSCTYCPSGTSTFGKMASKWRENCEEIPSHGQSNIEKRSVSKPILYSAIGVGAFVFIVLIVFVIFCVQKHLVVRRPTLLHDRRTHPEDHDIVHSTQTRVGDVEICEFRKCNLGFNNMNYLPHDCADEISEQDYKRSNFDQSEV